MARGKRQLIDIEAAAALLKVSVKFIYRRTSTDRIPHVKRGYWLRFDPSQLRRWRRQQKARQVLVSPAQAARMLTPDEAAAFLGRSKSWLYAQTAANTVPHVKMGHVVRFPKKALTKWAFKQGLPPSRPRGWSRLSRRQAKAKYRGRFSQPGR